MPISFRSDNIAGALPEVLEALARAARGRALPYGADELTRQVETRLGEVFETELAAFAVATGTAANALALSLLCPPYGAVYCHQESHVQIDECGAPELFTGGAKLVPLPGRDGKIWPGDLERAITGVGDVHQVQPAAVSISQATEAGTVYLPAEITALAAVCRHHGLGLHMDGARFANALVTAGCRPAELTWRAGVDVLSFGATKNGALAAEAVLVFTPALAASMGWRRKRGGHLLSKQRFLSAQLGAYLADDLWLRAAANANALARRLATGLAALPGVEIVHPVEANEVFARLPEALIAGLLEAGFDFYRWGRPEERVVRLVAAFDTAEADVETFLKAAGELTA